MYLKRLTHELIIGKLLQTYLEITVTPSSLQVHLKTYRPINDWEKYLPPAPYYLHDVDALSLLQKQATKRYRDRNSINFIMRSGLLCYFDLPKLHFNGSPHIHCSKFWKWIRLRLTLFLLCFPFRSFIIILLFCLFLRWKL